MAIEDRTVNIPHVRPMPVAFVTTSLGIGGAERLLFELIQRIDRTRFAPVLVCLKQRMLLGTRLAEQGFRVYSDLLRGRFDLGVVARLASVFGRERVQVVCTVGTGGDRSFWGRIAARWAGVPVVISCPHSMGVPDKFERSNRLLSGITDAFVAVAHRQKSYLVRSEGFSANKIHVIHNGVDTDRFVPAPANPVLRSKHGIPADSPLAGIVAYLRPEKNAEAFLRAARIVHDRIPAAHFVIVGDGPERKKLEALTRELDLSHVVHFAGLCQDVREWVRAMDVVLLTSICEAFPVSLLEAMACGKPVIATRVGAIPEMIVHGETGYLVRPRDHRDVAEVTCRILSDPAAGRRMGRRGREHVVRHFSLGAMVSGYEKLFTRLVARKLASSGEGLGLLESITTRGNKLSSEQPILSLAGPAASDLTSVGSGLG